MYVDAPMEALSQSFRALGDATRLRILRLVARTPLNVTELVSLVGVAQPSVSHHLGKLRSLRLIREERQSAFTYYSLAVAPEDARWPLVKLAVDEGTDLDGDLARLQDLLRRREDRLTLNDRLLEPGQSFQLWARALGTLLPRVDVADMGCGSGALTVEIARWARSVLAIDSSQVALAAARERARREGLTNITFLQTDLTQPARPARSPRQSVAIASQSLHFLEDPAAGLRGARSVLKRGGKLLVLELLPHGEEWVRDRLGHRHLGFEPRLLAEAAGQQGFRDIAVDVMPQSATPFRVFLLRGVSK